MRSRRRIGIHKRHQKWHFLIQNPIRKWTAGPSMPLYSPQTLAPVNHPSPTISSPPRRSHLGYIGDSSLLSYPSYPEPVSASQVDSFLENVTTAIIQATQAASTPPTLM